MALRRALIFLCFLLFHQSLYAQITDSIPRVDSAVISKEIADTPKAQAPVIKDTERVVTSGYIIHAKVIDAGTGEGLPFATIVFQGSTAGTVADLDGNFIFKLDKLPSDTLVVKAIGYTQAIRVLRKSRHDYNYIIELERSNTSLKEFVFEAGEDPAVVLVKQIIAHKPQNNPDRTENYKYEAYNRLEADLQRLTRSQFKKIPILKNYTFVFDNLDTVSEAKPYLPLYLTETISDYYFQRNPKKDREYIKASMVKGVNNENVVKYLGTLHQNVNVYKDFVPVFDKKFVSPISDNGLFYYKYKIKDTQVVYGHNVILVQFKPRRAEENCFNGDFWVVDSIYAIQRISMDVSQLANINWVDRISLYQEFAPVDSFWFPVKDKFVANFTLYNSKKLPGFIGRKTTTYHKIVINDPSVTDKLNDKKMRERVSASDSAKKFTDDWWDNNRPDSLSANEKAIYKMVDTINKMPITTYYKNLITFLASGVKDFGPIQLGPYYNLYSSNTIEGSRIRVSLGTARKFRNIHFDGYGAYGFKDDMFKYGFSGTWIMKRHPWTYLYGYYAHDVIHSTNYYDQLGSDNIFSTMFRKRSIPWKLAFADEQRVEFYKSYFSGFSHQLVLRHQDFMPYYPLPDTTIFTDYKGKRVPNVVSSEVSVKLRYAYKEDYLEGNYQRWNLGSKYPVVNVEVGAGFKGILNSAYDYQKVRISVTESINIPPFGHLYYNVFAGKYFGTIPYPLLEIHPGNEFNYYNQYAFQMMNNYEFISDQYAGFNIEHNIGGGIFNRIPLFKKLKFRQFWTAKGLIGSLSPANQQLNLRPTPPGSGLIEFRTLKQEPYLELGTGVSNILQVFRIDLVWRVTPALQKNEPQWKYFGIFGSVRFQF
ncbi:MAG: carboxypeptidase-like regulatory protein [Flavipsychrobacter sp.]|jgi:hypothetical protein|nr:carboxypeptidase-like regulatory protein [Flavipsychrobacter sp.]